jgi:hypothetical protein
MKVRSKVTPHDPQRRAKKQTTQRANSLCMVPPLPPFPAAFSPSDFLVSFSSLLHNTSRTLNLHNVGYIVFTCTRKYYVVFTKLRKLSFSDLYDRRLPFMERDPGIVVAKRRRKVVCVNLSSNLPNNNNTTIYVEKFKVPSHTYIFFPISLSIFYSTLSAVVASAANSLLFSPQ